MPGKFLTLMKDHEPIEEEGRQARPKPKTIWGSRTFEAICIAMGWDADMVIDGEAK